MAAKKIVVTGGSGKAGRAVVRDLLEHGYDYRAAALVLAGPREVTVSF